jgi:hypothetical protein
VLIRRIQEERVWEVKRLMLAFLLRIIARRRTAAMASRFLEPDGEQVLIKLIDNNETGSEQHLIAISLLVMLVPTGTRVSWKSLSLMPARRRHPCGGSAGEPYEKPKDEDQGREETRGAHLPQHGTANPPRAINLHLRRHATFRPAAVCCCLAARLSRCACD